jgi:predicted site-specific integrase-resolvase
VNYACAKGYIISEIVTEVGSGLNDTRKKLQALLQDRTITLILVEHRDRLARFGTNYIERLLEMDNRRIEVVNPQDDPKDDLMGDFVSIVTSFCARLYGQRRTKRSTEKLIKELSCN